MLLAIDLVVALCFAVQFALAAYFLYLLYWLRAGSGEGDAVLPADAELPRVLVQIPIYNEPMVVERALLSAGRLDAVLPRQRKRPPSILTEAFRINSLTMSYFHTGTRTIIGAEAFHCPVRDGKEWDHLAMVIRQTFSLAASSGS